ncbi:unnamed protein product [Meloidogyne enterolobii]|uniref:Uncharacterized protein n=1 Tax=Meloidogyne enterolobii TaxID=390850 RepID=A0ACB1B3W2_MELEN
MDALHSKVAELERTVNVISRKNHFSWNNQQSKNLLFSKSGFRNMEGSSEHNRLQQQKRIFQQLQSQMLPRPVTRAHLLVPQGQLEPQNSFEKRMVSWQPVKREDPLLWTEEISEQKIYDAIAREKGKSYSMLTIEQQLAVLRAGERLGISPEAILEHLRIQNGGG